jgi:heat shock protein HtpX
LNLLEQEAFNRRRTWEVVAAFVLFVALIGAGLDVFVVGAFPALTVGALALATGSAFLTYRTGDRMILASSHARPLAELMAAASSSDDQLRYKQLQDVVEEVAIAAGLPPPVACVIPDDDPNAFATGRDPAHASIAVTAGLLRSLNREELQGVVAHEMGHVRNFDIRLMMIVSALVGAVVLLADWAGRSLRFGIGGRGRRGKDAGVAVLIVVAIWIVAVVLALIAAQLMALCVSRRREYQADASSAELTRNPLALASALEKINDATAPTTAIKKGSAALCIADPLERAVNQREGGWSSLWATHPPMAKRIAALKEMAYASGPGGAR